jgi:hypothetical protein
VAVRKNIVSAFLPATPVGEQNGDEKLAGILFPRQPLVNCNLQVADRTSLKSGVGIPQINQKVEPRTGYQINLRSGATGKKVSASMDRTF